MKSLSSLLTLATCLRIGLLIYATFQDRHPVIKYTDIDYLVFSDAARFLHIGGSPYERATYRYTPILAWMMVPTVYYPAWGKWMFCVADILVTFFIYRILGSNKFNCRN
jgi:phosphatidylinositol glycan class M